MRFHMLQNAQMALDFLRYKKIKLVNIRAEDIVDGNPKLTLGLIWTIILHFQVSRHAFISFISFFFTFELSTFSSDAKIKEEEINKFLSDAIKYQCAAVLQHPSEQH